MPETVTLSKIREAGMPEMQSCCHLPRERRDPREAQPRRLIRARPPQPHHSRTPPETPVEVVPRLLNQACLRRTPIEASVQVSYSLQILYREPLTPLRHKMARARRPMRPLHGAMSTDSTLRIPLSKASPMIPPIIGPEVASKEQKQPKRGQRTQKLSWKLAKVK